MASVSGRPDKISFTLDTTNTTYTSDPQTVPVDRRLSGVLRVTGDILGTLVFEVSVDGSTWAEVVCATAEFAHLVGSAGNYVVNILNVPCTQWRLVGARISGTTSDVTFSYAYAS